MENTIDRLAAVRVTPFSWLSSSAMGAANTLQAYMAPMQRLIRQLAASTNQRFFVRAVLRSCTFCDMLESPFSLLYMQIAKHCYYNMDL